MKFSIILTYLCIACGAHSQLASGLDENEVKDMILLCNSYTYLDLYGDDSEIIPDGYRRVYTSPVLGMDNKFQVYRKGAIAVFNFRGSTDKKISWMENLHSSMIPVEGEIKTEAGIFNYKFGADTAARVHSGFSLALSYLYDPIIEQIKALNNKGVNNIILTGHSQGGALVILLRSLLHYSTDINSNNRFKVYTFAQPMSGNAEFADEYNKIFCAEGMSYSFVNPEDHVTRMPLSHSEESFKLDLIALVTGQQEVDEHDIVRETILNIFEDRLRSFSSNFSESVSKQIQKELGEFSLPEESGEIDYVQVENQNLIPPPFYPLEMKDSSLLQDSAFMVDHPRDENGIFINKGVYKKITMAQHHKPYNYFTGILQKYFPKEYEAIEPKSFGL